MVMIIIILTASYIGDDVRIVYALANTMRYFSVTDGGTDGQGDSRSRIDRFNKSVVTSAKYFLIRYISYIW